jgi:RHS repeat-associated protein
LVEKKLPGKGWEYMVYNKADQLVMNQDTNLKSQGKWLFTKYDQFGRIIYTGITNNTSSRQTLQTVVTAAIYTFEIRSAGSFTISGMPIYYTNHALPGSLSQVLSINYYDSYPAYTFNPSFPTDILGEPTLTGTPTTEGLSTKSLPVMSLVKNIEDDNWTKNYTYYDKKGRAIGSYSINHLGGRTKVDSKLDFAGAVQQSITRHKRLNGDTDKIITENFTYDHQNRLLAHTHQVDTNPVEYLAQNTYNEISQLTNKKVGGTTPSSPLQSVDYAYNIRGWMTKINDPANLSGKLYGYEMKYQNPQSGGWIPQYNGNISEIDWKSSQDDVLRRYNYEYDPLNRLVGGYYLEPNSSIVWVGYFHEYYNYDLNGNITRLVRMGKPVAPQTTAQQIDELIYTYAGNRLITVSDASQNNSGYPLGGSTISYDVNGNMTNHLDKGISLIQYNYQNLPKQITSSLGNTSYIYRADGGKVKKIFGSKITDYLDGFQYENAVLKFSPTSEGYFNFENNKYIYNYTDHLGNIRISYFNNGSGVEVLEENNYYPFGLKHEGYNGLAGNPSYQYKYNGKELQETGMYDYGARFYMPDLGRWGVVDPLAEKMTRHSPYNYAFNNPIRFVDPDGRKPDQFITMGDLINDSTSPSDWYQNLKTGNYEWKDSNKEIKGYKHLGKRYQFGESYNGQDRMYYLHLNGSATEKTGDNSFTLSHAENNNSITTINGETITSSATSVSGLSAQISYTKQLMGPFGVTGSLGYVADADTGTFGGKLYYSVGWSMSVSAGFSADFNAIKASNPETLFNARRDFQGFGNSVSLGYGGGFVLGASSATNNFVGSGKDYNLMQAGRYDGGYTTFGVTYGFGKPSIGASLARTHTQFINLKRK